MIALSPTRWAAATQHATSSLPSGTLGDIADARRLAGAALGRHDYVGARQHLERAFSLGEAQIRAARYTRTDAEMHALLSYLAVDADVVYSTAAARPTDAAWARVALRFAAARKGRFALEQFLAASSWKRSVAARQRPVMEEFTAARRQFTHLLVLRAYRGADEVGRATIETQSKLLDDVNRKLLSDTGLSRLWIHSTNDFVIDQGPDALIANVSLGRILVVYVHYQRVIGWNQSGQPRFGEERYLALVGHAGAAPAVVPLGLAAELSTGATAFVKAVSDKRPDFATLSRKLFRQLVAPLEPHFTYRDISFTNQLLFICPDGELFRVPFAALLDGDAFLLDKYRLRVIDSPLDTSIFHRSNDNAATSLVALSNPTVARILKESRTAAPLRQAQPLQPLREADQEAKEVAALWPEQSARVLSSEDVTVEALVREAPAAGILHIAAHGAFVPDLQGATRPRILRPEEIPADSSRVMASWLARSVVFLTPSAATATGAFSALDAAGLDLRRTQLVVLAACDTGVGDFERGEGIYGLRRAFLEAGAETVVSTLWQVDSAVTRRLMLSFYRSLFQGESRAEALYRAARFTRLSFPHPYYWSGFAVTGSDSALRLPPNPR